MARQEKTLEKKRGRPAIGAGVQVNAVLRPEMIDALDAWAAAEDMPEPRRPEAVRRALADHLRAKGYLPVEAPQ